MPATVGREQHAKLLGADHDLYNLGNAHLSERNERLQGVFEPVAAKQRDLAEPHVLRRRGQPRIQDLTNQQNQVTLFDAFSSTIAPAQTAFGQCGTASYWDIGVRGDTKPGPNTGSGFTLNPTYSVLDDAGYASTNLTTNPAIVSQYCNGARVPPTCSVGDGCGGPNGFGTPPGIVDAAAPNPVFSLIAAATVDEGNNWINVSWGPLALSNDSTTGGTNGNYGGGALFANYALNSGSAAIDYIPTNGANGQPYPTTDFFGNPRPDASNPGNRFDVGAIEHQGTSTAGAVLSVTPTSLTFGNQADGTTSAAQTLTLQNTGTATANTIAVAVTAPFSRSGGTCGTTLAATSTCTINIVFSPTATVTQTTTDNGTATITAGVAVSGSPVALSGMETVAGPVPTLASIIPTSGFKGDSVNVTLNGTNLTGAEAITFSGTGITSSTPAVVSATQVTATFTISTTAATGVQTVHIITPNGTTTQTVTFTVLVPPAPTLASVIPNSGTLGSTVSVTLTGANFTTSGTTVAVTNGVTVGTVWVNSATQITTTFTIPTSATLGAASVRVTTPGGTTAAVTFTVQGAIVSFTGPVPALNTGGTGTKSGVVTVHNTGNSNLTLTAAPTIAKTSGNGGTGAFTITTGGTCTNGAVIAAGGNCTINVRYAGASNPSPATGTITLTDSGASTTTQTDSVPAN